MSLSERGHSFLIFTIPAPTNTTRSANASQEAIVICHSLPPFWARPQNHWPTCAPCPPVGMTPAKAIGRAMAETDIYHYEFVRLCNRMDEIWVPSRFSYDTLNRSGGCVGGPIP